MSQRKKLLTIEYHSDDDSGTCEVGEIDYGIYTSELTKYLKEFGFKGLQNILSIFGHLSYEIKRTYMDINEEQINDCQNDVIFP
jgi:hypothetical protein